MPATLNEEAASNDGGQQKEGISALEAPAPCEDETVGRRRMQRAACQP